MKNNLLNNLKSLQAIEPNRDYSQKSLNLILAEKQIIEKHSFVFTEWLQMHKVLVTSGVSGVLTLVLIVFIALSYLPGNKNSMVAEANDINNSIQIRLDEIQYHLNRPILVSAISEMQNDLNKAAEELSIAKDLNADDPQKLEEILSRIKNTRDILEKINFQLGK
ncbi:hypothetical protein HZC33_02150 [Candidatus Wolfebacteria bacterium]|nr:hypothetical protein [Candidatus Wolfebacteria bacterium]